MGESDNSWDRKGWRPKGTYRLVDTCDTGAVYLLDVEELSHRLNIMAAKALNADGWEDSMVECLEDTHARGAFNDRLDLGNVRLRVQLDNVPFGLGLHCCCGQSSAGGGEQRHDERGCNTHRVDAQWE